MNKRKFSGKIDYPSAERLFAQLSSCSSAEIF